MANEELEAKIMRIMEGRPASAETISVLTGLPSNQILVKLRRMQKWYEVEPVTKRTVIIWGKPRAKEKELLGKAHAKAARVLSRRRTAYATLGYKQNAGS